MLHVSSGAGNAAPLIESPQPSPVGFASTGLADELPGDFHAFMAAALAGEPPITDADLDAMWAAEMAARDDADATAPLAGNGRPVRVGAVIRDSLGTFGVVTHIAGNVIVYKLLPNQADVSDSQPYGAELNPTDVTVIDAARAVA